VPTENLKPTVLWLGYPTKQKPVFDGKLLSARTVVKISEPEEFSLLQKGFARGTLPLGNGVNSAFLEKKSECNPLQENIVNGKLSIDNNVTPKLLEKKSTCNNVLKDAVCRNFSLLYAKDLFRVNSTPAFNIIRGNHIATQTVSISEKTVGIQTEARLNLKRKRIMGNTRSVGCQAKRPDAVSGSTQTQETHSIICYGDKANKPVTYWTGEEVLTLPCRTLSLIKTNVGGKKCKKYVLL